MYTNKEDKWGRAQAFTNLGKNFHLLKDENKAIDYYKQALELGEYIDDKVESKQMMTVSKDRKSFTFCND